MSVIVRVEHIRKAKFCMAGARDIAKHYGLPWEEFLKNGLPAETLEALGDEFANQICAIARKEALDGRQ